MINAKQAAAAVGKTSATAGLDTTAYLTARIEEAVEKGYSSSRTWVKKASLTEAKALLDANGYKYDVLQKEENGNEQLEISW